MQQQEPAAAADFSREAALGSQTLCCALKAAAGDIIGPQRQAMPCEGFSISPRPEDVAALGIVVVHWKVIVSPPSSPAGEVRCQPAGQHAMSCCGCCRHEPMVQWCSAAQSYCVTELLCHRQGLTWQSKQKRQLPRSVW